MYNILFAYHMERINTIFIINFLPNIFSFEALYTICSGQHWNHISYNICTQHYSHTKLCALNKCLYLYACCCSIYKSSFPGALLLVGSIWWPMSFCWISGYTGHKMLMLPLCSTCPLSNFSLRWGIL